MKILGEEIFFSYLVTSILKELFEVKNDINVYFRTSLWYLKQFFYLSEAQKGSVKIKKISRFSPLFWIGTTSFYQMKLAFSKSYCQILHTVTIEIVSSFFFLKCELVLKFC